ncbi:hypothetical protein AB0B25_24850 [Nocardia sp. NPDC049190]|uniref:hypothetical protein n=1 Tax=Nocardia sp. NPDC049190 TaxID=3155650 RepID=UPI0033E8844B
MHVELAWQISSHQISHVAVARELLRRDEGSRVIELPGIDGVEGSVVADGCDPTDSARLSRLAEYITGNSSHVVLSALLSSDHTEAARDPLWDRCVFDHCAVMLFPADAPALRTHLAAAGFRLGATVPSVVVQQRVCARYGLDPDAYRIHIAQAYRHSDDFGREQRLEIFFPVVPSVVGGSAAFPRQAQLARDDERRHNRETHFAFALSDFDLSTYLAMRRHLAESAHMVPDGGGFNPHDRSHGPGCSTFYFTGPGTVAGQPWPRRLELICGGEQKTALTAHLGQDS